MKRSGKYLFILSEVLWTRHPAAITRAVKKLCEDIPVVYCSRPHLSWCRVLKDKTARLLYLKSLQFSPNAWFSSVVFLECLPLGRYRFFARANDFLFSLWVRMISALFLLYETVARSDTAVLTVWFFNPKHYPLISILFRHNVFLDTVDYFSRKPNALGVLLLRYTSSALIYRGSVPFTSMKRSMELIRWTADVKRRLQKTTDALRKVVLSR